jgi:hypothetical protein
VFALLVLATLPVAAQEATPLIDGAALGAVEVPGTRVRLDLPGGFEVAEQFAGLIHHLSGTTVVVRELGIPVEQASRWLEREPLDARGLRLLGTQEQSSPAGEALIVQARESRDYSDVQHWIALLGDETSSLLIVASAQDAFDSSMHDDVMGLLGSVRWEREAPLEPLADLPFRIAETGQLSFAPRLSERLVLMLRGQLGPLAGGDPRAFVRAHDLPTPVDDLERFALEHLAQSDQTSTLEDVTGRKLYWDGLPGHEIVARGADFEQLVPLVLYQRLALDADAERFYVVQGFASYDERERYLPEFRALARSFRRRR